MAQRRHYTSEFCGICKSNRNGKKKDGSSRMCIDYRKLNQKLVKDKFPLPIIEDVLDTLQEAKVYSTLDLRNGFFHVDVDEDCRKYTSFIVPDGQFEFNKVPFGLSTSPGVFQRYVSGIFRDLTRKGIVISYLDDLVIPAKNEQEGHIVESATIRPSPTKTLAVRKFPEPTTIKQVQSFLGLTGYFRKYIKDYSKIDKSLSDLTRKKNLFVFGAQQKEAFEKLKKIMSEGPILHLYKYGSKTELHTDAYKQGISEDYAKGANYSHSQIQLEEFDYEIEHRAGSRMKQVDALSRYPVILKVSDKVPYRFVTNCVPCILANKKTGKKEGFLNPISKESIPLSTYHVDFISPLPSTNKGYQPHFTVADAFTKFTWLYPVKTVSAESALEKLKQQQKIFGNPIRIISDRGSAFTSKLFNDYCDE
ncbi:hypothetical protein TNCV_3920141 [Trichonephila clavipes]|nr:hypothetical protein TNCV_3920141 [Trichonephila clavipes]